MNVSYEWLRAFVPFQDTPAKLRDLITSRVATVDELMIHLDSLSPPENRPASPEGSG